MDDKPVLPLAQYRAARFQDADPIIQMLQQHGTMRPEFDEYQDASAPFNPTDTAIVHNHLYVADGYGSNYITKADLTTRQWTDIFAGKTSDPNAPGLFGTAHGLNPAPDGHHLSIAVRPHARFEHFTFDGHFKSSYSIPAG